VRLDSSSGAGLHKPAEALEDHHQYINHALHPGGSLFRGFFAHFLNMQNGERIYQKCEFRTDTAMSLEPEFQSWHSGISRGDEQDPQSANHLLNRGRDFVL